MDLGINDLRVIVTAGANGIGLAIARAYARRNGGDIELCGISAEDAEDADRGRSATGLRAVLRLPLN